MARLADRWSLIFLVVTVALATAAWWFTGDPIRAVAVLVVATPCPLILAVPVALVAGLSRAAHFGVLIKGAKPLEALARIRTVILDKTGTLTDGRPQLVSIDTQGNLTADEILYFAAALDQASKHPIAQALVVAARERGVALPFPEHVVETPGDGCLRHRRRPQGAGRRRGFRRRKDRLEGPRPGAVRGRLGGRVAGGRRQAGGPSGVG